MIAKYVYHVCLYKVTTDAKVIFVTVNLQNKIWPHESQNQFVDDYQVYSGNTFLCPRPLSKFSWIMLDMYSLADLSDWKIIIDWMNKSRKESDFIREKE